MILWREGFSAEISFSTVTKDKIVGGLSMTFGKSDRGGTHGRRFFHVTLILAILACAIIILTSCDDSDNASVNADDVKIVYCLNNGEGDITQNLNMASPLPSRDGFAFEGWSLQEDCDNAVDINSIYASLDSIDRSMIEDGKIKVYAMWRELDVLEGIYIENKVVVYDGKPHSLVVSGAPEGAEIEFSQHDFVDAGEYVISAVVRAEGYQPLTLQGQLTILKAQPDMSLIRFSNKSYIWDGSEKSLQIEGELPEGVTVTYKNNGKTDVGIYQVIAHIEVGRNYLPTDDLTATLTITELMHTVRFIDDGQVRIFTVPNGKGIDEIPAPISRKGYTANWDVAAANLANVTSDVTVTAKYDLIKYKISYHLGGGELAENVPGEFTVKDSFALPRATKEYYEFEGWIDGAGVEINEIKTDTVGDIVVYAVWRPVEYQITFDVRGGINDIGNTTDGRAYVYTAESENRVLKPAERKGYMFEGWYGEDGVKISCVYSDSPKNFAVYAKWRVIVYSIEYILDGGSFDGCVKSDYTVEDGDIPMPVPLKSGYSFDGWHEKGSDRLISNIVAGECRDFVLYSRWSMIEYSVTYVMFEGVNDERNISKYNVKMQDFMLFSPAKEGYHFEGWYDNDKCEGSAITTISTSLCRDVTLYAKWREEAAASPFVLEDRGGKKIIVGYDYTFGKNIVIPSYADGVAAGVLCSAESIKIDAKWTTIAADTFDSCDRLQSLVLPDSLEVLPHGLLKDCTSLQSLTLPFAGDKNANSTESIFSVAALFGSVEKAGCYDVYVSVQTFNGEDVNYVFDDKSPRYVPCSLKEIVILGGDIPGYAFDGWKGLETLKAYGGKAVNQFAFRDCTALKVLQLSCGFENIAPTAVRGCTGIEAVTVPIGFDTTMIEAALRKAGGESANAVIKEENIIYSL